MNADASLTITWTNNTNGIETGIYIQALESGTWTNLSTVPSPLPPGTTSATIVNPPPGPYRVDPVTPPPGPNPPPGNPPPKQPNPGPQVSVPIPVQTYASIDISGTVTAGNAVSLVALSDTNQVSFGFGTDYELDPDWGDVWVPTNYSISLLSKTNGIWTRDAELKPV